MSAPPKENACWQAGVGLVLEEGLPAHGITLALEINAEHERAYGKAREALEHARRAGDLLIQAKAEMPHGDFGPWLTSNCRFSDRTARAHMRLARHWEQLQAKTATVADLGLSKALALLGEPNEKESEADPATFDSIFSRLWHQDFTAENTTPEDALIWISCLSPETYFDCSEPECDTPYELECLADAIKTQRYFWLDSYLALHKIAGVEPPSLISIARDIEISALRKLGALLNYWEREPWDVDKFIARCDAKLAALPKAAP